MASRVGLDALQRCKPVEAHEALGFNCGAMNALCIARGEAELTFAILALILLIEWS